MKLSKTLLTLIVAGAGTVAVTTSCDKEEVRPNESSEMIQCAEPGDNGERETCHACGMG